MENLVFSMPKKALISVDQAISAIIKKILPLNQKIVISGKIGYFKERYQITNPTHLASDINSIKKVFSLFIQCKKCSKKLNGCCSKECKDFASLPIEKQKILRKDPKYVVSKTFFDPRVKPKLRGFN